MKAIYKALKFYDFWNLSCGKLELIWNLGFGDWNLKLYIRQVRIFLEKLL